MVYTAWSVVFGEQPSASKWNQLGTNDAHFYSFLGDDLAWQSWTPTFANWTIGTGGSAGTTATYTKIGRTVHGKIRSVLGTSGQSVGTDPTFTLPVTAAALSGNPNIGTVRFLDAGTEEYPGSVLITDTTHGGLYVWGAGGGAVNEASAASNSPFVWVAGDSFVATFTYESAA